MLLLENQRRFNINYLIPGTYQGKKEEELLMSIKKKFGGAILATALGATLIGGGTFALFTSTASNTGNTFTAGTVVITDTTGGAGSLASQAVNFSNLAPGDNGTMNMTVRNDGNLDEWVHINEVASTATETGGLFSGTTPVALSLPSNVVKLAPGDSTTFTIGYNFPSVADNSYQAAKGSFNVKVDAVQARNNTNAAGNGPTSWQ